MRLSEWHYQPRHVNPRIQETSCKDGEFDKKIQRGGTPGSYTVAGFKIGNHRY